MVSNGHGGIVPKDCLNRIVGECVTITCFKCKRVYEPNDKEISTKNPNMYYKTCINCREKMRLFLFKKKELENKYIG